MLDLLFLQITRLTMNEYGEAWLDLLKKLNAYWVSPSCAGFLPGEKLRTLHQGLVPHYDKSDVEHSVSKFR